MTQSRIFRTPRQNGCFRGAMPIAKAFKNFQFEAYLRIAKLCAAFRALPLLVATSVCNRAIQPTKSLRNVVLIIFNAAGRGSHLVVLIKGTNLKNRLKGRAMKGNGGCLRHITRGINLMNQLSGYE